jgi:hypothetical protein
VKALASDGSHWLKDIMEDEMPKFQSGLDQRGQRAESRLHHARWEAPDNRLNWADWLLILAIFAGLLCVVFGVTIWSDVPMGGAR